MAPDAAAVRAALRQVMDPEAGMNIVDLGLVRGIACGPEGVAVQLTLTSAACPMGEMVLDDAQAELEAALPPGTPLRLELVWEPPWSPEDMSPQARAEFGWEGPA